MAPSRAAHPILEVTVRNDYEDGYRLPRARPRRSALPVLVFVVLGAFTAGTAAGYFSGSPSVSTQAPAAPSPSASPAVPTVPTDPHGQLVSRLPAAVYSGCLPQRDREGGKKTASVTCSSPMPGADELLVTAWSDGPSMLADFTTSYGTKPDGKCGDYAGSPTTGRRSTWDGGPLACYINTQGAAILLWEYRDLGLQVLAVRRDRNSAALFSWWRNAVRDDPT